MTKRKKENIYVYNICQTKIYVYLCTKANVSVFKESTSFNTEVGTEVGTIHFVLDFLIMINKHYLNIDCIF